MDYILVVPTDTSDKEESYKFPFVCNEILSSQSTMVLNYFFPPPNELERKNSTGSMVMVDPVEKSNEQKEDSKEKGEVEYKENKQDPTKEQGLGEKITMNLEQVQMSILQDTTDDQPTEGVIDVTEETSSIENVPTKDIIDKNRKSPEFNQESLDYLFNFLKTKDKQVNEVQAGYFKNIIESLMNQKAQELCLYFFDQPDKANGYIAHQYSKSISESCMKFVSVQYNPNSMSNYSYWEEEQEDKKNEPEPESPFTIHLEKRLTMLFQIQERFKETTDFQEIFNISEIFKDNCDKFHLISNQKDIFERFFMTEEVTNTLMNIMLNSENELKRMAVCKYFKRLFVQIGSGDDRNPKLESQDSWFKDRRKDEESITFIAFMNNMEKIKDLFSREIITTSHINTFGDSQQKQGLEKISILDQVESMLSVKNLSLTKTIADSGILNVATSHFAAFPANNIYGNLYLKIAKGVINSANDNLVKKFMSQGEDSLLNIINNIVNPKTIKDYKNKDIRKLNQGQVIAILREMKKTERQTAIEIRDQHPLWTDIDEQFQKEEAELQDREFYKETNVLDSVVVPGNLDTIGTGLTLFGGSKKVVGQVGDKDDYDELLESLFGGKPSNNDENGFFDKKNDSENMLKSYTSNNTYESQGDEQKNNNPYYDFQQQLQDLGGGDNSQSNYNSYYGGIHRVNTDEDNDNNPYFNYQKELRSGEERKEEEEKQAEPDFGPQKYWKGRGSFDESMDPEELQKELMK